MQAVRKTTIYLAILVLMLCLPLSVRATGVPIDEEGAEGSFVVSLNEWEETSLSAIPLGVLDLTISLEAGGNDLDVRLYDQDANPPLALIGYDEMGCRIGIAPVAGNHSDCASGAGNAGEPVTLTYQGMEIFYSGWKGIGGDPGAETISIRGETTRNLEIRAYAYEVGTATVSYEYTSYTEDGSSVPGAPTDVTVVAGDGQATVTFSPPESDGGSEIVAYTVTADPGGLTETGAASPITVTGLTNGITYTFTVTAANGAGTSVPSAPSNAVTPNSANAALQSLIDSEGRIDQAGFDPDTLAYVISVGNAVASITVTPTVDDPDATVQVNGERVASGQASRLIALIEGDETAIEVVVTAADGTTKKTYTVTVMRAPSNNAYLDDLTVAGVTLDEEFESTTYAYMADVANGVASVTVTPVIAHPAATVTVNGAVVTSGQASDPMTLAEGAKTPITVVVTAQDGSTKTYTITIDRAPSTNAALSGLSLSDGVTLSPDFAADHFAYTAQAPNAVTSIRVTPVTAHAGATVTVNGAAVASGQASGPIALAEGNTVMTVDVMAQDLTTTETYTITVRRLSRNANLSSLSVAEGEIDPDFDPAVTTYTMSVANDVTSVAVSADTAHPAATVQVSGNEGLLAGANTVTVTVTAEDGSTKTYTITVTRAPSTNAALGSLSVSEGDFTPDFDPDVTAYEMTVPASVMDLTVNAAAAHPQATVQVSGNENLAVGATPVSVVVTAEDGTTKLTYTITVTRLSNDATLASLSVAEGDLNPDFDPAVTTYSISVANEVTDLTVNATASHAAATVQVTGGAGLVVGPNTVTVTVTAEDGTTKTYTITVTRAPSTNAALSSLSVGEGDFTPDFDPDVTEYKITVPGAVMSLTVNATAAHPQATVQVTGNENLVVGATPVSVVVTAEDGNTTRTYTITVTRLSNDATLSVLSVDESDLDFDPTVTMYSISVANEVTDLTVNATASHAAATVQVTGGAGLVVGVNTVTVAVTAADGTTKTYTITVTRAPSDNAYLDDLTVAGVALNEAFESTTFDYTATVANEVASAIVKPVTAHPAATVTVNGVAVTSGQASDPIALAEGANTPITVVVTAQSGSTKTYTITIARAPSANAALTGLSLSNGVTLSPDFATDHFAYTAQAPNAVTSITVTPVTAHAGATVTVNGAAVASGEASGAIPLAVGDNIITIMVTAQDGATTESYAVTVRRLSSDASLSWLSVDEADLDFDPDVTEYTLSVANDVTSITVAADAAHPEATVQVTGNADLSVGANTITVAVTAEDGTEQTYTITVNRAPSANAALSGLTPSSGTLRPLFAMDLTDYNVSVSTGVRMIRITPTVLDSTATVTVNGELVESGVASSEIALRVGANPIDIVVTAQDGETTTTYTVTVRRAAPEPDPAPAPQPQPQPEPEPEPEPRAESEDLVDMIKVISGGADPAAVIEDVRPVTAAVVGTDLVVNTDIADGTAAADGPVALRAVELSSNVLERMADTDSTLHVQTNLGDMEVPAAAVVDAPGLPPVPEEGAQVTYRFRMEGVEVTEGAAEAPAVERAVLSLGRMDADGLRPAGRVLTLEAERIVTYAGGTTEVTPIRNFARPITVRIPFDEVDDPASLAVYRLNEETGEWEYRGGTVNLEGGYVEIELSSFSQYTVMEYVTFDDIQQHWAQSNVERMAVRRMVTGIGNRLFAPDANLTRAEFATLLVRLLKLPVDSGEAAFQDVSGDDWFRGYVAAAAQTGLIQGHEGLFRPHDAITREEMAAVIMRAAAYAKLGHGTETGGTATFTDEAAVAGWAQEAVAVSAELGLLKGRPDGRFAPTETATRAEATVLLERLMDMLNR